MSTNHGKRVCHHACAKSIRSLLKRFRDHLTSCGYSIRTVQAYVSAVQYFGRWLGRRQVNWSRVDQFLTDLPICQCPGIIHDRRRYCAALRSLLKMLGQERTRVALPRGYAGDLLRQYQAYLVTVRGLAETSIQIHLKYTRLMLSRLGIRRGSQFAGWTPKLIEQYVSREGCRTPSKGRIVPGCTRSFLRFLQQVNLIHRDLAAAVPQVARWRLASLPPALRKEEVERLVKAAGVPTPLGRRDQAMVLCMSELGLRASDVACLELDGIDFTAGVLRLRRRKEREAAALPMPRRLSVALKAYLRRDRPACASPAVFIRHLAPLGKPLTPIGICQVVLRAASRAGLRDRVGGTHVLRHSLASRMLGAGATLKQIADLLGHQCLDTTGLYAKVDLVALSRVALPWPLKTGVQS